MRGTAIVLAVLALVAALLGWSRWISRRRVTATGHWLLAGAAAACASGSWWLSSSLAGYEPMRRDAAVAEIHFEQTGSRRFRATLVRLPAGQIQVFEVDGDQWRLDARTLEWRGAAARLGLRPAYQLEQLAARSSVPVDRGTVPVSRFPLAGGGGSDLWTLSRTRAAWGRYIVGRRATGPWKPMANDARYVVRLGERVLRVAPENEAAARVATPR